MLSLLLIQIHFDTTKIIRFLTNLFKWLNLFGAIQLIMKSWKSDEMDTIQNTFALFAFYRVVVMNLWINEDGDISVAVFYIKK